MNIKILNNLKMNHKVYLAVGLVVAGLAAVLGVELRTQRAAMEREKQLKTRHLVETAYGVIQHYQQLSAQRMLTEAAAKEAALAVIKGLRYEGAEYFWINDLTPRMVMHPMKPELDGKDLTDYKDPAGKHLFVEFADMARRSYIKVLGVVENMSEFVAPDGSHHAIFGEGGGRRLAKLTGAPLVGAIPIETAVSAGGDHGKPVVLDAPDSAAAGAFEAIAAQIVTELLPPVEMAGCSARMLDAAVAALDQLDELEPH